MKPETFDCQACGACCCNPLENQAEGYVDYIEVRDHDVLWRHPRFARKLVVYNAAGEAHLRLDGDRCAALRGTVGMRVRCAIYEARPTACRRVEAGGEACRRYRKERHIS